MTRREKTTSAAGTGRGLAAKIARRACSALLDEFHGFSGFKTVLVHDGDFDAGRLGVPVQLKSTKHADASKSSANTAVSAWEIVVTPSLWSADVTAILRGTEPVPASSCESMT